MPLSSPPRILLTGAGAQLASALQARFSHGFEVVALTRHDLDVTLPGDVARAFHDIRPQVVLNCASFNDVDGAERQADAALAVNGLALASIAREAAAAGSVLVHFSTDFVFDPADDPGPLTEQASVRPRSVYAQSKLLGEIYARQAPRHYVLRVASLFGGAPAKSSIDAMAARLRCGESVRAFADRTVSPSYVYDVADATAQILSTGVPYGLFHCVNSGHGTWLDVALALADALGADHTAVTPVPFGSVTLTAPRPKFAALSNAALVGHGVVLPHWREAIGRYATSLGTTMQR